MKLYFIPSPIDYLKKYTYIPFVLFYEHIKHIEVAKRGRPRTTFDETNITSIIEKLEKYIDETDIPIVAEFCYQNKVLRESLYQYAEFDSTIKHLINKKEAQLERMCLNGDIDRTMSVFSLKQLGWKDQHSVVDVPKGKRLIIEDSE